MNVGFKKMIKIKNDFPQIYNELYSRWENKHESMQLSLKYLKCFNNSDIDNLMVWSDTPEGHTFWNRLYNNSISKSEITDYINKNMIFLYSNNLNYECWI